MKQNTYWGVGDEPSKAAEKTLLGSSAQHPRRSSEVGATTCRFAVRSIDRETTQITPLHANGTVRRLREKTALDTEAASPQQQQEWFLPTRGPERGSKGGRHLARSPIY